jgi:hypothetical protein
LYSVALGYSSIETTREHDLDVGNLSCFEHSVCNIV